MDPWGQLVQHDQHLLMSHYTAIAQGFTKPSNEQEKPQFNMAYFVAIKNLLHVLTKYVCKLEACHGGSVGTAK